VKVVVFTWDRYDTLTTPMELEKTGVKFDVVCHTQEAADKFAAAGRVRPDRLLVSNAPKGLANNRNWYLENHCNEHEWILMLVDDWMYCTELPDAGNQEDPLPVDITNTTEWNRKFRKKISMGDFFQRAGELAIECNSRGATLGGFAGNDNAMFRRHHWKKNVLADGRAIIMKKTALRFDPNAQMVDDVCFTAQTLERFGLTLVNQWVLPYCKRYTKGGYGSKESRMEQRLAECAYLVRRFPGLVKFADKTGWPEKSHVHIQSMTPDRLRAWRLAMDAMQKDIGLSFAEK
jgi:hypothetical protein